MSTEPAVVELRGVSKRFGNRIVAVDDVSLRVQRGETVALLGTSGCGKTTTLRLINRLAEPDAGEVLVRGQPVRGQTPEVLRRSIGYVIQEGGLFPHRSVADNVATVPRLLRWSAERTAQRVAEVLDLVGLPPAEFADRRPHELSGGQRQRIGVARALAGDPDLLLMDEPFGALDPITRESLHDEFLALQARLKKTVVLVTHDMIEAGRLADRIVLMEKGRIVQSGTMREFLVKPASEFVQTFFASHRQQIALETLRLDDVLDDVETIAAPAGAPVVALAGKAVLGAVLGDVVRAAAQAVVIPTDGRHTEQTFPLDAVRSRVFDDLIAPGESSEVRG